MAKALPFPSGSAPIFTRAGQRPLPPVAGSRAQAWGGAIQQTGKAVEEFGGYLDKRKEAQGKAQMDTDYRNAQMQEMIKKRELAMEMQASKLRMENMQYDFKVLAEKREQDARKERAESHGWEREKRTREENHQAKIDEFGKWLFDAQAAAEKTGSTQLYNRNRAIEKLGFLGIQNDPNSLLAIDKRWPVYSPRAIPAYRGRAELTAEEAKLAIPYLEQQLRGILDKTEEVSQQKFDRAKVVSDFMGGDYRIFQVDAQPEKRRALQKLEEQARKKMEEIAKNKVKARISFEQGGTDYMSVEERLNQFEEENQQLQEQYQQLLEQK